jgi:hypothetical protein
MPAAGSGEEEADNLVRNGGCGTVEIAEIGGCVEGTLAVTRGAVQRICLGRFVLTRQNRQLASDSFRLSGSVRPIIDYLPRCSK